MKVIVKDNTTQFLAKSNANVQAALRMTLEEIHSIARGITPLKKGDLRRDVSIQVLQRKGSITWNREYASVQEAGKIRGRTIRNYTTPGTGKGFAKRSVQQGKGKFLEILRGFTR